MENIDEIGEKLVVDAYRLDREGETLEGEVDCVDVHEEFVDAFGGVRYRLNARVFGTELLVRGSLEQDFSYVCSRCGKDFDDTVKLSDDGKTFLKQFLPQYFNILLNDQFKDYVSEIIIEGHTDTDGGYLFNLELSQERALAVATYCLTDDGSVLPAQQVEALRTLVAANGKSYSDPILNQDGSVNMDASRRVEFKFRLKDEEMVNQMLDILNGGQTDSQ